MKGERRRASFPQHYSGALRTLVYGGRRFQNATHVPQVKIWGGSPSFSSVTSLITDALHLNMLLELRFSALFFRRKPVCCSVLAAPLGLARSLALPFHQQITRRLLCHSDLPQACDQTARETNGTHHLHVGIATPASRALFLDRPFPALQSVARALIGVPEEQVISRSAACL